jgi:eukaryotic-like serine/threonine-protein kinase
MEVNRRIGDYEILDEIGSGGMGRVYRVRNVISDRVEAMKVLLPDLVGRQDLAARFLREIKLLAALSHPNIAALRTALTADNQLVMIMEYVEGQSLAKRLMQGAIPAQEALDYIDQVLDALTYAHARHIVHRDVKPANMLLMPQGVVKLTDFGIARSRDDQTLTVTGTTTGSLSYMSPEQVKGEATDARSDLYSLGISLYEMVTGRRPFQADSDFAVMMAHLERQPKPPVEFQPGLPAGLNEIILKAISKEPARRYQSAGEFRQALKALPAIGDRSAAAAGPAVAAPGAPVMPAAAFAGGGANAGHPASATPLASAYPATVVESRTPSQAPAPRTPATAANVPAAQMRSGHPLLFVALGAVLVIVALVGTGLYLGRAEGKTEPEASSSAPPATPAPAAAPPATASTPSVSTPAAASEPAAGAAGTATSTPPPATVPAAPAAAATEPAPGATSAATPAPAHPNAAAGKPYTPGVASGAAATAKPSTSKPAKPAAAGNALAPAASQPPAAREPAQPQERAQDVLDRLDGELDQLIARAGAVNNSLDRLQQEQARQGLGLRSDMAARQTSMNSNLSRAREALEKHDAGRAQKFRDAAERDIEALEQFLGR